MSDLSNEILLAKWLEGNLTHHERETFEKRCIDDADFSLKVETANRVSFEVTQEPSHIPPVWDKTTTIAFSRSKPQRQWGWLPVTSMAMSLCAMLMVVSGFQVQSVDGSLHIGFNLTPTSSDIAQLVDAKLQGYQDNNQALMTQYIDALQTQNNQSRTELTRFLLDTSREERREDFAELIKFINEQRDDDQRFYARQINKLESELYSGSIQE